MQVLEVIKRDCGRKYCLKVLQKRDPTVGRFDRPLPINGCGLREARSLGVSPPIDPRTAWRVWASHRETQLGEVDSRDSDFLPFSKSSTPRVA